MFCKHCGQQISDQAKFCPHCGKQLAAPAQTTLPVRLTATTQKPVNGLGIAAFVIGIVTLLLGLYLFLIAIVGIVLGALAVAHREKYRLNGLAIAGLVISCVAFALWLIIWMIAIYYAMIGVFLLFLFPFFLA